MTKRVVVIASGPTERSALPHLLAHLETEGIAVDIRIPDRHRQLKPGTVRPIIYSALYDSGDGPPDKFVVLVDTDGKSADEALRPIRQILQNATAGPQSVGILYAYAQWHLEAWYFADYRNLRDYLGRNLGSVDATQPDRIQNPKHHLQQLLGAVSYTTEVSEKIARMLDAQTIAQRSPSFAGFLAAVRNGGGSSC